jgi:NADH:ubiquinone reductase (H+-translocating)
VVGGGPTGVAISGSISEMVRRTLPADFRTVDLRRARIVLIESGPRLLPAFSEEHSDYARRALERDGIEVKLGVPVSRVDTEGVTVGNERIEAATVLWCTGVQGVPVARQLDADTKANGRIVVGNDLSIPGHPECFVVGDAAYVTGPDGRPIPGLASIAQRQGRYVGEVIAARIRNEAAPAPFDRSMPSKVATITRHYGVAEWGDRSITGFVAWLMWGLLHLKSLSGGHSKLAIIANWLRLLATYRRSARVIIDPTSTMSIPPTAQRVGPI